MRGATYVCDSGNTKIMGSKKVDATYVSIDASCPSSCPLKDEGCYAQLSFVGIQVTRLNKEAEGQSALQVARAEAETINNCYGGKSIPNKRDLRLHVAGDSRTLAGTRILNKAIGKWKERGGGDCWSYTHAWQHVPREEWSNVDILASINTVDEVIAAKEQGYAPAIVVSEHPSEKAYKLKGSDIKWIPCPNQTRKIGCTDCRLCFDVTRLYDNNFGIAFSVHGVKKNNIKRRLNVIK